ncbi:MAG: BrnT family toxin [Steroidobacteraceae bacterium]
MAAQFGWDPAKDIENRAKHGVAFREAQLAFLDRGCVIARDLEHSDLEERFYCFGKIGGRILTVRFTYRSGVVRIIGAGYWRRGRRVYEENQGLY